MCAMTMAVAEDRTAKVFPTTYGFHFTADGGFNASATAAPAVRSALSASPVLNRQFADRQELDGGARPVSCALSTSVDDHVGWKGLLEMSRSSGASGIVGVRHMSCNTDSVSSPAHIEVCATAHTSAAVRRLVKSVTRGLMAAQEPESAQDGMGGTYFFCNENGRKAAILKPCDEEPLAPNNPKGYVGRGLGDPGWKPSVRVGEAAMREVAAYLLDREGFAKVPTSVLVRARHSIFCYNSAVSSAVCSGAWASTQDLAASAAAAAPPASQPPVPLPMKLGSLQEFVPHECDTTEMGPSRFSVSDVHRIGILDIRLFNTDRHAGNMLVRAAKSESSGHLAARMVDSQFELIPIDHGFCLPETLDAPYFEWLHWPQAMLPFSEDELQYIRDLDCEADKELLRQELPVLRPECIRVLELTTALLKRCAGAGMTLFEIGSILSRPFVGGDEDPSELEKMCEQAKQLYAMQEIAEEDEDTCSDCGEEDELVGELENMDNDDEDERLTAEELGIATQLEGELFRGKKLICSGPSRSNSIEEEALIFDLEGTGRAEDDMSGDMSYMKGRMSAQTSPTTFYELGSPNQFSIGSSTSSAGYSSSKLPPLNVPTAAAAPPAKNMAKSVHGTGGLMWRMTSRRRQHGSKSMCKPKPSNLGSMVTAQGLAAGAGGGSINFAEFDDSSWARFKAEVLLLLEGSIKSGRWRQGVSGPHAVTRGVAMSCPFS